MYVLFILTLFFVKLPIDWDFDWISLLDNGCMGRSTTGSRKNETQRSRNGREAGEKNDSRMFHLSFMCYSIFISFFKFVLSHFMYLQLNCWLWHLECDYDYIWGLWLHLKMLIQWFCFFVVSVEISEDNKFFGGERRGGETPGWCKPWEKHSTGAEQDEEWVNAGVHGDPLASTSGLG